MSSGRNKKRFRTWAFTYFGFESPQEPSEWPVRFVEWQLEKCPETERLHLQGWFYSDLQISLKQAKLFSAKAHFKPCYGTAEQNSAYCTKLESRVEGPWSHGNRPRQGLSTSYVEIAKRVLDLSVPMSEVQDVPSYAFHERRLLACRAMAMRKDPRAKATRAVKTTIWWGPSGCGKSHAAMDDEAFVVQLGPSGTYVFDDYDGEDIMLFEDFHPGALNFRTLLRILDKYRFSLPCRYANKPLLATDIRITADRHPRYWYNLTEAEFRQFARRVTTLIHLTEEYETVGFNEDMLDTSDMVV